MFKARLLHTALLGALVCAQPADIQASSLSRLAKKYWKPVAVLTTIVAAAAATVGLWQGRNFNIVDKYGLDGRVDSDAYYTLTSQRYLWYNADNAMNKLMSGALNDFEKQQEKKLNVKITESYTDGWLFSTATRRIKVTSRAP